MRKIIYTIFLAALIVPSALTAGGQEDDTAEGVTELLWWMPGSGENTKRTWTSLEDRYEEVNLDRSVEFVLIPWSEYFTKLNAAFAGGLAPDLFGLGYGQMGPVQANGNCLPLDEYLKGWDGWDDIPANILKASYKDGRHWSIMIPDIKLFYYRKDIFEQAGLEPPETTDELLEHARLLSVAEDGKTSRIGLEISTSSGEQDYFHAYLMFGGESLWDEDNKPTYNSPTGLKTIRYLNSLIQDGTSVFTDEHALIGGPFENGIAAMDISGAGGWVTFTQKMPGKVGIAPSPGGIASSGATFLNISANTGNPEAAVQFLVHLLSVESQQTIYINEGRVPTRISNKEWFLNQNEYASVIYDAMLNSRTYGSMNPHFFDFLKTFRPALEEVYYNRSTPEEAFAKAEQDYLGMIR